MILQVKDVSFSFGVKPILNQCSLQLTAGEVVSLVGLSGSGKTTLLRMIAGLEKPHAGEISCSVPFSFMPQSDMLLPWRTVLENLYLPFEISKREASKELLLEMLKIVGLEGTASLYPKELSGGMKQRVAFVRALASKSPLLLLDEPFNAVDLLVRERLYAMLRSYLKEQNASLIFVSHDYRDALAIADRLCLLKDGRLLPTLQITEEEREDPQALASYTKQIKSQLER
jgi:ABC-type nitrate/sulfonate/bicarbonate transport system ATPase subunit